MPPRSGLRLRRISASRSIRQLWRLHDFCRNCCTGGWGVPSLAVNDPLADVYCVLTNDAYRVAPISEFLVWRILKRIVEFGVVTEDLADFALIKEWAKSNAIRLPACEKLL